MDVPCSPVINEKARKRGKNPDNWKVNKAKFARYSPKSLPEKVCNHNTSRFKCATLTMKDLIKFHNAFYKEHKKSIQDALLLRYCKQVAVKRRRPRNEKHEKKQFTTKFFVPANKNDVPVCQNAFLNILGLKKYRIQYVMKRNYVTKEFPVEKRGGDHKSHLYRQIRKTVHDFLSTLKCTEAHYCRSKTAVRRYLPSELNIKKLFNMYKEKYNNQSHAKLSYFRKIFNCEYNLGFGTPQTDMCSTCLQLNEKIKRENDNSKKQDLIVNKRIHTLRAKAFFELLKTKEEHVKIISFDCQKNQPLPKLPDQSCYYSRQLYLYNLTVVEGSSKEKLTPDNVFAYTWTEDTFAKDSNTIASIIYHKLNQTDLTNVEVIRLISDGCGGQNKNSFLLSMCCKWLLENSSVKQVELVFPVTGHSYLPSDRVFGQIEKKIKKKEIIVQPNQYLEIISQFANVIKVGDNCPIYNWKEAAEKIIKPPGQWHFKFMSCKRFYLKRSQKQTNNVFVQGEAFYKTSLGKFNNICRKGKFINMITPSQIMLGRQVKAAKLKDVQNLLVTHYGTDWTLLPELNYYFSVVSTHTEQIPLNEDVEEEENDEENNDCCEFAQDSQDPHI